MIGVVVKIRTISAEFLSHASFKMSRRFNLPGGDCSEVFFELAFLTKQTVTGVLLTVACWELHMVSLGVSIQSPKREMETSRVWLGLTSHYSLDSKSFKNLFIMSVRNLFLCLNDLLLLV